MQLDDLKATWLNIEQQLEQHNALQFSQLMERKQQGVRGSLRPLFFGQCLQLVLGIALVMLSAPFWIKYIETRHLLIVGLTLHVYGIMLIVAAARVITFIRQVDFGDSVVAVQKQLLKVERNYIIGGWLVGLPWWFLWIPFTLFVAAWFGFDIYAELPRIWIWSSVVVGLAGTALTLLVVQWARRPSRPALAAKVNAALAGSSLTHARRHLVDIQRFEASLGQ